MPSNYERPIFHATCLAALENEFGWVVGLADEEFDTKQYLQFQRGHTHTAQDQAPGLNTYYVERDDQSNSCYGGIERIDLGADAIALRLGQAGSQSLGLDRKVVITFDADERTLQRFKAGLIAVFAGTDLLRDRTSE